MGVKKTIRKAKHSNDSAYPLTVIRMGNKIENAQKSHINQ